MTTPQPAAQPVHPRSAVAVRRGGARATRAPRTGTPAHRPLTAVDSATAPRTYSPGSSDAARTARGVAVYIGIDEATAAAAGTNLTAIAQAVQQVVADLAPAAETQAVIAMAPDSAGRHVDAVRAVAGGSQTAVGSAHGPVRQRLSDLMAPPPVREREEPAAAEVRIDIPRREVRTGAGLIPMTAKEFDLLATLVSRAGTTLSRTDLIDAIWTEGSERPDERTVDVHIRRLRRRLGEHASIVRTIRGAGYRFDPHPDVAVWHARAHG